MRQPMEAAASPLPREDTTPPVTKMYFDDIRSSGLLDCAAAGSAPMPLNFGEPDAPSWQRDQGGACRGARSIMDGFGRTGKAELERLFNSGLCSCDLFCSPKYILKHLCRQL